MRRESRDLYLATPPTGQIQHSNFLGLSLLCTQAKFQSKSRHCSDTKSSSAITPFKLKILQLLQTLLQEAAADSCENTHIFILCDWLVMEVFTKPPWVGKCQFLYRIRISSLVLFSHIWAFKNNIK